MVIVDDEELVRTGVRAVLAGRLLTNIVGEGSTVAEGIELCRELRPDVVVTGLLLPDARGTAHIEQFRRASPRTSVIVLSVVDEPHTVVDAIRAGAIGYVLKAHAVSVITTAVDRALAGEEYVDPEVAARVIRSLAGTGEVAPGEGRPAPLTPRELEVLREVARGSANKEIARDLQVTAGTIKVHIERILGKLGAVNRAEASTRAIQLGLLDLDGIDLGRARTEH